MGFRERGEYRLLLLFISHSSSAPTSFPFTVQATPGNIQQLEDLLFSNTDNISSPIVMALKLIAKDGGASRHIGVAFADASARGLGVAEFLDDEMFSNTEVRFEACWGYELS